MSVDSSMKVLLIACTLLLMAVFPAMVAAQQETPRVSPETDILGWFLDHVSIRQSLKDKNFINKAALLQLTLPDEGAKTRLVAAAATFDLYPRSSDPNFNIGLSAQFNENTSESSRQNSFFGGADAVWLRDLDTTSSPRFSRLTVAGGFKRDGVKQTKGMAASSYWSLEQLQNKDDAYSGLPLGTFAEYLPLVGVEHDWAIETAKMLDEGHVTRALASVSFNAYPLAGIGSGKQFILSAELSYRRDILTDFEDSDRDHPLGVFGVAVSVDRDERFLIALERVDGEDPSEGFEAQGLWRVSLKVQLSSPQKRSLLVRRAAERLRVQRAGRAPVLRHPR